MKKAAISAALVAVALVLVIGASLSRGPKAPPEAKPGTPAALSTGASAGDDREPRLERRVSATAIVPGEAVEITLTVHNGSDEPILALAIEEDLPEGWQFQRNGSGAVPAISPREGSTGVLNFVWVQVPPMPLTFSYFAIPDSAAAGATIVGNLLYRRSGGEEKSDLTVTEIATP